MRNWLPTIPHEEEECKSSATPNLHVTSSHTPTTRVFFPFTKRAKTPRHLIFHTSSSEMCNKNTNYETLLCSLVFYCGWIYIIIWGPSQWFVRWLSPSASRGWIVRAERNFGINFSQNRRGRPESSEGWRHTSHKEWGICKDLFRPLLIHSSACCMSLNEFKHVFRLIQIRGSERKAKDRKHETFKAFSHLFAFRLLLALSAAYELW